MRFSIIMHEDVSYECPGRLKKIIFEKRYQFEPQVAGLRKTQLV